MGIISYLKEKKAEHKARLPERQQARMSKRILKQAKETKRQETEIQKLKHTSEVEKEKAGIRKYQQTSRPKTKGFAGFSKTMGMDSLFGVGGGSAGGGANIMTGEITPSRKTKKGKRRKGTTIRVNGTTITVGRSGRGRKKTKRISQPQQDYFEF